jgi:hypothetical protein
MAGSSAALVQQSSEIACGQGDSFCSESLKNNFVPVLRSDPCAVTTLNDFNTRYDDYVLWMPKYRRATCESNGYVNCGTDADRFGPKQVTQESFLQGRGQVANNTNCPAGEVRYLPPEEFKGREAKPSDMSLFAQPTVFPRSCKTLTEVDMQLRIEPLPGAWQGSFSPLVGLQLTDGGRATPSLGSEARRMVTLGTRQKYPEWGELKESSEPYTR